MTNHLSLQRDDLAIDILSDGQRIETWISPGGTGPCQCIGVPTVGPAVDFRAEDAPCARWLALVWGLDPLPAEFRTYTAADGPAFLLAIYGTHSRGSRFTAIPHRAGLLSAWPKLELHVASREEIEKGHALRLSGPHLLVSVRDPGSKRVKVRTNALCRGVLELAFSDAEPCAHMKLPPEVQIMTPQQAVEITRFMHANLHAVDALMVHCEAGMSRSPAVAIAVGGVVRAEAVKRLAKCYNPNMHVIRMLLHGYHARSWLKPATDG